MDCDCLFNRYMKTHLGKLLLPNFIGQHMSFYVWIPDVFVYILYILVYNTSIYCCVMSVKAP